MFEITFHGAAEEVGRSCIEIKTKESRFLLDAGLWIAEHGVEFPSEIENMRMIDAIFLSHAHLDHTGALPLFDSKGINCPIFSNMETKLITKILLRDSFKISRVEHQHVAYKNRDIEKVIGMFREVKFRNEERYKDVSFSYFNSGHIPGSCSILIKNEGKTLLYTGDINTNESHLLNGADTDFGHVDYMITESTYGDRDHPDRKKEEEDFIDAIRKTLERKGIALVPAFAVGRAQEVLLMIDKAGLEVPIYVDGMAKSIAEIMLQYPSLVKDHPKLKRAIEKAKFIREKEEREEILKEPCIIITTSGMVNGGPVMYYLQKLCMDSKNSILMTGYQGKNTNGRMLLENNAAYIEGYLTRVKMEIFHYDFSAHSGMKELHELISKVNPEKLIIQHGDKEAVEKLAGWCTENKIGCIVAKRDQKIMLT